MNENDLHSPVWQISVKKNITIHKVTITIYKIKISYKTSNLKLTIVLTNHVP